MSSTAAINEMLEEKRQKAVRDMSLMLPTMTLRELMEHKAKVDAEIARRALGDPSKSVTLTRMTGI